MPSMRRNNQHLKMEYIKFVTTYLLKKSYNLITIPISTKSYIVVGNFKLYVLQWQVDTSRGLCKELGKHVSKDLTQKTCKIYKHVYDLVDTIPCYL
jgi:hypothetical protein